MYVFISPTRCGGCVFCREGSGWGGRGGDGGGDEIDEEMMNGSR